VKNLKVIMAQKGINNLQLSDKTGIDLREISKYRNLKGNPTIKTMEKIAMALGVNVKDLL